MNGDREETIRALFPLVRRIARRVAKVLSVAELDDASLWNRATLGIAAIHSSRDYLHGQMHEVEEVIVRLGAGLGASILETHEEIMD